MILRFTIKNSSRYARMLETLEPWPLLDALRWGVGMRQVACADMVNANVCTRTEDTLRLSEYERDRAGHVPTVEIRVQGPVSLVVFEWDERVGNNGNNGNNGDDGE